MSWEDQGRQDHGWFGHGSSPATVKEAASGAAGTGASESDRATGAGYGAIGAMPAALRARAEAAFQGRNLTIFRDAMLSWMRGSAMTPETFGDHFFGRAADDPVVNSLRDAAKIALTSTNPGDMAAASGKVAEAMQKIGLDRWSRFMADAQARAQDPATEAAIKASIKAPDAITPVHPEDYLIGIVMQRVCFGLELRSCSASSATRPTAKGGPWIRQRCETCRNRQTGCRECT